MRVLRDHQRRSMLSIQWCLPGNKWSPVTKCVTTSQGKLHRHGVFPYLNALPAWITDPFRLLHHLYTRRDCCSDRSRGNQCCYGLEAIKDKHILTQHVAGADKQANIQSDMITKWQWRQPVILHVEFGQVPCLWEDSVWDLVDHILLHVYWLPQTQTHRHTVSQIHTSLQC